MATGKLEKMLILAFDSSEAAESGGTSEANETYEALINPETYTLDYKLKYSESGQGQGTSGKQLKYEYTEPEEMTFEFLFDDTGIAQDKDGKAHPSVVDDIKKFKDVLIAYKGDAHEPRHFKLVWGENSIFKGRVTEVGITYKLFKPDGTPIRAVARVTFKSSSEEKKRVAKEDKHSSDLSLVRTVKTGDALPLMCYKIYGDPRYYLQVAEANRLTNFRSLKEGMKLVFPSLEKKAGKT